MKLQVHIIAIDRAKHSSSKPWEEIFHPFKSSTGPIPSNLVVPVEPTREQPQETILLFSDPGQQRYLAFEKLSLEINHDFSTRGPNREPTALIGTQFFYALQQARHQLGI